MSFFAYTQNIPNPPNNPSTDVPNMQTNTNSVFSWPLVDHYGYEDTNNYGGWHKQITLVSLGNNPTLPPLTTGNAELYTNTVPTAGGEKTELFFTPDTTGNVYQMTRTSSVYYASFANDAQYAQTPPVATQFGGWTFLPGGLLLQYGSEENLTATGTIKFPRPFNTGPYNIQLTLNALTDTFSSNTIYVIGDPTTTSFNWGFTGTTSYDAFNWLAIGY
jgi:hypothetical protein